mgnify:CR=1 FL=1
MDKKFCINIHSKRRRLTDPDGISGKAVIDGLAEGGIFADDSSKYIQKVSFSQEVTKGDEETIVDVFFEST